MSDLTDSRVIRGLRNPHDLRLQRSWETCRRGMLLLSSDPLREQVIGWLERMQDRHPNSPDYRFWFDLILKKRLDPIRELLEVEEFTGLPLSRRSFWRSKVQSHPFVSILKKRESGTFELRRPPDRNP